MDPLASIIRIGGGARKRPLIQGGICGFEPGTLCLKQVCGGGGTLWSVSLDLFKDHRAVAEAGASREHRGRPHAQPRPARRGLSQARQAGARPANACSKRAPSASRSSPPVAGDGPPLRRLAQLRRRARRHQAPAGPVRRQWRCARDHAAAAARPARCGQDALCARAFGAAGHRNGLSVDELDDRRLGAQRRLEPVERRAPPARCSRRWSTASTPTR